MKQGRSTLKSFTAANSQALTASYLVSLRIAKTGKPHTIGESLILPAAKDIVSCILGEAAAKKLDVVPLSNNTVSRRIHDLASQVKTILIKRIKQSKHFAIQLDELWLMKLAYLADIFGKLNELNSSLQGRNITPFVVADKINATIKKLRFMLSDVEQLKVTAFQSLQTFLTENELRLHPDMVEDIKKHCSQLISNFQTYFPEQFDDKSWIRNPFSEVALPADFSVQERDQFIELSCDGGLKSEFNKDFLSDFWLKRRAEYGLISDRASKCLISFSTSYLCETGFYAMLAIKNKYRSKLELEPDLRLKLTLIKPDIADLCKSKQAQCSH